MNIILQLSVNKLKGFLCTVGSTYQGEDEDEPRKEVQRGSVFFRLIRFPSVKNCIWVGKS